MPARQRHANPQILAAVVLLVIATMSIVLTLAPIDSHNVEVIGAGVVYPTRRAANASPEGQNFNDPARPQTQQLATVTQLITSILAERHAAAAFHRPQVERQLDLQMRRVGAKLDALMQDDEAVALHEKRSQTPAARSTESLAFDLKPFFGLDTSLGVEVEGSKQSSSRAKVQVESQLHKRPRQHHK
jgi:hypothetical protein